MASSPISSSPTTGDMGDMGDMGESGQGGGEEPASHPDPEPGADHAQAGSDS